MDICNLKNAELETKAPKDKGRVVLRGDIVWYCERWFWILCSIHWTRIISFSNDSSKSHGYHLQIARVRRTSSWRSICFCPSENGRCSTIFENSQIGMSRHLDSSTTTQMAKIMVQYGRPSRFSWAWTTLSWMERNRTLIRCGIYSIKKMLWENQHLSLIMCTWDVLKDNAKFAKILLAITEPWLNQEFPRENWKITILGKYSYFFVVLRYGRSCPEMCGTILWVGKQYDSTTLQSIYSMHRWPSLQRGKNWKRENWKNYHTRKIFVFLRGPRIWKVMPRNVWNDIVSWQTRRLDNYKVSAPCIDDHHFKEGRIESGRTEKLPYSENIRISSWS